MIYSTLSFVEANPPRKIAFVIPIVGSYAPPAGRIRRRYYDLILYLARRLPGRWRYRVQRLPGWRGVYYPGIADQLEDVKPMSTLKLDDQLRAYLAAINMQEQPDADH